jgi:hypothetical protein
MQSNEVVEVDSYTGLLRTVRNVVGACGRIWQTVHWFMYSYVAGDGSFAMASFSIIYPNPWTRAKTLAKGASVFS